MKNNKNRSFRNIISYALITVLLSSVILPSAALHADVIFDPLDTYERPIPVETTADEPDYPDTAETADEPDYPDTAETADEPETTADTAETADEPETTANPRKPRSSSNQNDETNDYSREEGPFDYAEPAEETTPAPEPDYRKSEASTAFTAVGAVSGLALLMFIFFFLFGGVLS